MSNKPTQYKAYEYTGDSLVYSIIEVDEILEEKDKEIAELKDKCQMHNFFWDGCGFAKRGFKNSIAVSEAFDRLEAENAELKRQIEFLKVTHDACGECNKCADGMCKVFDENLNELKQKLENVQASAYADSVDAGMRERRLRRALWIARANRADGEFIYWCARFAVESGFTKADIRGYSVNTKRKLRTIGEWIEVWKNVKRKCRAKAEGYK